MAKLCKFNWDYSTALDAPIHKAEQKILGLLKCPLFP